MTRQRELLSIERKVLAGFLASVVGLLLLGGLVYRVIATALETAREVASAQELLTGLERFQAAVAQAENAQRGYYLSGTEPALELRHEALRNARTALDRLHALTADNPAQRAGLLALESDLADRIAAFESLEATFRAGGLAAVQVQLPTAIGPKLTQRMHAAVVALAAEEDRALARRRDRQDAQVAQGKLVAAGVLLVLLLFQAALFWRIREESTARQATENELHQRARFDATHREALTLFNSAPARQYLLDRLLQQLAGSHPFPVSAFYAQDPTLAGHYVLAASHGATAAIRQGFAPGEGLVGQVARGHASLALPYSPEMAGFEIDAGVARFAAAELLLYPVSYQDYRHGVLVLAASRRATEGERAFLDRLTAQLGVALHNLKQLDDVKSLAGELSLTLEDVGRKNALLEESSRMKSEFLANMSHELRTPLNAIIGFSEVLRDGLLGELSAKQSEYVGDIFESGRHLLALINDILDLSKIEAGKLELDLQPLALEPMLANSLAILREKASERRLVLELDVDPSIGTVRADPRKTRQIVYNLVSNAIKFSREDARVVLRAHRVPRGRAESEVPGEGSSYRLGLPDGDSDSFVEITVTDSGIGLAPEDMARLFQPFVQIESSLSRQYEGTGLGLAMVRRLAELHGGTVAVASTPGRGSSFTVWLPYRPADGEHPVPDVDTEHRSRSAGATALVIEDDANATELMRSILVREGYRVVVARSAEDGLELARENPAVIVLDILLPGMDGWECLERLKQAPALAQIPVVIVSMVADREKGRALGAAAVLQKPLRREELLAAVGRLALPPTAGGMRVLLIDDDPKAVELAACILLDSGCQVLRAYGGVEGITQALRAVPDLIVLDLMMPGVNGFDVVAKLRTEPRTAQIPILVLTSKVLEPSDHEQLAGRVQSIVTKDGFGRDALLNEVRRALAAANAASPAPAEA